MYFKAPSFAQSTPGPQRGKINLAYVSAIIIDKTDAWLDIKCPIVWETELSSAKLMSVFASTMTIRRVVST
jgi:hypothetical protein